jgi:hypothetical protein
MIGEKAGNGKFETEKWKQDQHQPYCKQNRSFNSDSGP